MSKAIVAVLLVFVIYFCVVLTIIWAVVDYGQAWDDCRVEGGTFKAFSAECVKDDNAN